MSDLLRLIGEEAYKEPELRRLMLDPPAVMGVQSIDMDHFQIRLVTRTLPGKQFDVARILRARIAAGLRDEDIHLPATIDTAEPTGPADATSATSANLDLDPDRGLPGHPGHLGARHADADADRRQPLDDGAVLNLTRVGPDDVTANHHADDNGEANANEFGIPDWHTTPGPLTDGDAVRGSHAVRSSDANSLSHRFGVTLAAPPGGTAMTFPAIRKNAAQVNTIQFRATMCTSR